jgi:hypothetical protein
VDLLRQIAEQVIGFLQSYAEWWARAMTAVSEEFDFGMPEAVAQFIGVFIGFIVLAAFMRRLVRWDSKGDKPQPFPLKTTETPNEVVAKDREKLLMMLLRVTLFVLFVLAVVSSR